MRLSSQPLWGPGALAFVLLTAAVVRGAEMRPALGADGDRDVRTSAQGTFARQEVDTIYLLGGSGDLGGRFEVGSSAPDWQGWTSSDLAGAGDFAWIWPQLEDADPCNSNHSPQVGFIDDGVVVPGTGGTFCITWCYGPNGYIVNNSGGLLGPDHGVHDAVVSPALAWPDDGGHGGAQVRFDVYRHEELGNPAVWPGIYYAWAVRSTASGDPGDLGAAPWRDRGLFYFGGPEYLRHEEDVTDLVVPGCTHLQVRLECLDNDAWGWSGQDGTSAPYFDNVAVVAYEITGPTLVAREVDLAHDAFPEIGIIDFDNLQVNWCRFDMASNIGGDLVVDFGDSIVVDATTVRPGAALTGPPRLYYRLRTNPHFNGVRGDALGTPDAAGVISGHVTGDSARTAGGAAVAGRWAFDLPDTGHLYPGDLLHCYVWAEDAVGGGNPGTAILPADTTGFAFFGAATPYDAAFTVRFLPTVFDPFPDLQPPILVWDDWGGGEVGTDWVAALEEIGADLGYDYDVFRTRAPAAGVGSGLGGRATVELLDGYRTLLYDCGNLSSFTIQAPGLQDPTDDVGLLDGWFDRGGKTAFFTGDDLAYDLDRDAPTSSPRGSGSCSRIATCACSSTTRSRRRSCRPR